VATNWILGIRAEENGLRIEPAIPAEWPGFKVVRRFRNAVYQIEVNNPNHVSSGIQALTLDGQPFESHLLPIFGDGQVHKVNITLG
jgi:cellobiose phosphorylase